MAGIGFVIRKLMREDTPMATFRAYMHAALAAAGPWILTILTIGGITLITYKMGQKDILYEFRLLLVYNFSCSLVLSSPLFLISTRYLADRFYEKDLKCAPGVLITTLSYLFLLLFPLTILFYRFAANLKPLEFIATIANFLIINSLWLVSLFVSIIQDFRTVTASYLIGGAFALITAWLLVDIYGVAGLIFGFDIGLSIVLGILLSQIFSEFNYEFTFHRRLLSYFKKYWQLALSAFFYNSAAWCDKWMMWASPRSQIGESGLRFFDTYDSAMFISQLTIIPSMAMFLLTIETEFFEKCRKFYEDIIARVTYSQIEKNHKSLMDTLSKGARNIFIFQGGISLLIIFVAPPLFETFNFHYLQIGIFRLGTLGACFQIMVFFILILFTYFDARKAPLIVSAIFLGGNVTFTYIAIRYGFQFYGYGYFLSSLLAFIVGASILIDIVQKLPYQSFIIHNQSVQKHR